MRRNESPPVAPNALPFVGPKSANLPGMPTRQEPAAMAHCSGDLWEETLAHWENAWIDLGGEG